MDLVYVLSLSTEIKIDEVCFVGRPDNQCLYDNAACTLTSETYRCICKDEFYKNTAGKCTPSKF
jgi:hypothetical protein